jgi:carboxypeptidase C (cathepsin A)
MKLFLVSCCLALASAAIDADEVKVLPGFSGALPSKHYSGYLEVPGDRGSKFYHYWFVESEGDPKTDPVGLCE